MRRFEQRTNEVARAGRAARAHRSRSTDAVEDGFTEATVEDVAIEQRAQPRLGRRQGLRAARRRRRRGLARHVPARPPPRRDGARRHRRRHRPARAVRRPGRRRSCSRPTTTSRPPTSPRSSTTSTPSAAPRSPRRSTTRSSPTSSRSCPRTTRSRSSAACATSAPPTSSRRWSPTTPPTCSPSCRRRQAEQLLQLMEPDEAAPLRRLLTYDENTAGGLMTTEPVILGPEATIAEALAVVRRESSSPPPSPSTVFVCRPPLETPTGKLPRHRPHPAAAARAPARRRRRRSSTRRSSRCRADAPLGRSPGCSRPTTSSRVPVVDDDGRLLGAVTVDDVLDHILPEDWREERHDEVTASGQRRAAPSRRGDRLDQPREAARAGSCRPSYSPRRPSASLSASGSPGSWARPRSSSA